MGREHPIHPNRLLDAPVNDFFARYPLLNQDATYVDFMRHYAGANIQSEQDDFVVDIFGFNDSISTSFLDEQEIFEEDGYLSIWGGFARDNSGLMVAQGFLIDTSGKRQPGIYRGDEAHRFWYYCPRFLDLLEILLASRGHMPLRHD